MRIPFVCPDIREDDIRRASDVLRSGFINEGKITADLEEKFAAYVGTKYAVATTSGTMALYLICHALWDVYRVSIFHVPSMTFYATASAPAMVPTNVHLFDDPIKQSGFISHSAEASIVVHLGGQIAPLPKRGWFIEDAAHALGSYTLNATSRTGKIEGPYDFSKGRKAGNLGIAAAFSFQAEKLIGIGQGGMITTSDEKFLYRIQELKNQGRLISGDHYSLGFNARMTDYQAALALCQLERIEEQMGDRYKAYDFWMNGAFGSGFDIISVEMPLFTRLKFDTSAKRDHVFEKFEYQGIQARRPYTPLHMTVSFRETERKFPHTMNIYDHELWLPNHRLITDRETEILHSILSSMNS